jgi:hypothetical protein
MDWMDFYSDEGESHVTGSSNNQLAWFLPPEIEASSEDKKKSIMDLVNEIATSGADLNQLFSSSSDISFNEADLVINDKASLYIGSYHSACDDKFLRECDIQVIVNCGYELINKFPTTMIYKKIPLDDVDDSPLGEYLDSAVKFIHEQLESGKNVLVHCMMGKSRSAAIVIAYLLYRSTIDKSLGLDSLQKAYLFLKSRRPIVSPNPGFMKSLALFEKTK